MKRTTVFCLIWLLNLLLLVAFSAPATAETINATTCSNTDVGAAIASAVDGVDTVHVPPGTCTWDGKVIFAKNITLEGHAPIPRSMTLADAQEVEDICATPGQTTYTCIQRTGTGVAGTGDLVEWTTTANGQPVWKNMAVLTQTTLNNTCSGTNVPSNKVLGIASNLHITGMFFAHNANCGSLIVRGYNRGLINKNTFFAHNGTAHALVIFHDKWLNIGAYGDKSWASPLTLGTEDVMTTEDNTFVTDLTSNFVAFTDHQSGTRHTTRYNLFINGQFHHHGTESGGRSVRAPVQVEFYGNTFTYTNTPATAAMIDLRGSGVVRIFDNTATGLMNTIADTNYLRSGGGGFTSFYTWAFCGKQAVTLTRSGTVATATTTAEHGISNGGYINITGSVAPFNVTGALAVRVDSTHFTFPVADSDATSGSGTKEGAFDGNTDSTGYPCIDQPGRSPEGATYISGDIGIGGGVTPVGWPNQPLNPMYCFNNTDDGVVDNCDVGTSGSLVVLENRDIFNQVTPFTGAAGIGVGERASRPSSPSTLNVAWWSSDFGGNWHTTNGTANDGCLDRWNGTAWVNCEYTPSPYPHSFSDSSVIASKFRRMSGGIRTQGGVRFK